MKRFCGKIFINTIAKRICQDMLEKSPLKGKHVHKRKKYILEVISAFKAGHNSFYFCLLNPTV